MPWITVNSEEPKPPTFEDIGYVQVVRCKDCKYGFMTENGDVKCEELGTDDDGYPMVLYHNADWFCADGERKS